MFHALMTLYFLDAIINDWQKYQWECLLIGWFGTEVSSEFGVEAQTFPKPLGIQHASVWHLILISEKKLWGQTGLTLNSNALTHLLCDTEQAN